MVTSLSLINTSAAENKENFIYDCEKEFDLSVDNVVRTFLADSDYDIVLLAGKGHETYQILNTGVIHFDEREVIRDILGLEE